MENAAMTSELLRAYSKDPIGKWTMENSSVSMKQKNTVCWDELTVFLNIWKKIDISWKEVFFIEDRSRDWYTEMQTTAAASMLAETIIWVDIKTVLTRDYIYIKELWLELSPRRRRSWVTALLATRNAIHFYLGDGISESFEELL